MFAETLRFQLTGDMRHLNWDEGHQLLGRKNIQSRRFESRFDASNGKHLIKGSLDEKLPSYEVLKMLRE